MVIASKLPLHRYGSSLFQAVYIYEPFGYGDGQDIIVVAQPSYVHFKNIKPFPVHFMTENTFLRYPP